MAVSQLPGVDWIEGNVKDQTVALRYAEEQVPLSDVQQALRNAGYPPEG